MVDTGDGRMTVSADGYGSSRLQVTQTAAPSSPDRVDDGWVQFAHQLRFALERHPGAERSAERVDRPATRPDGEEWFRARDDLFGVVLEEGTVLLAVEGDRATISRYGGETGS